MSRFFRADPILYCFPSLIKDQGSFAEQLNAKLELLNLESAWCSFSVEHEKKDSIAQTNMPNASVGFKWWLKSDAIFIAKP